MIYESIISELLCEEDEMFTIELDWADEEKSDSYKDKAKENLEKLIKSYDPTKAAEIEFKKA